MTNTFAALKTYTFQGQTALAVANTDSQLWKRTPFRYKHIRSFENVHLSETNTFAALKTYTFQGQTVLAVANTDSQLWKRTPFRDKQIRSFENVHLPGTNCACSCKHRFVAWNTYSFQGQTVAQHRNRIMPAPTSDRGHEVIVLPWYHTAGRSGCCRLHAAVRASACRFSGHNTNLYPHIATPQVVLPLNFILFYSFQTMFVQIINSVYLLCRCSLYW